MTDERPDQPQDLHDQAAVEAAEWLSGMTLGTADMDAFQRWREAHPAHALAFARVSATWEALGDVVGPEDKVVPKKPQTRRTAVFSILAATTVGAGGALYAAHSYAWTTARTRVGEYRKVRLPDSSILELNTDSEVAWRFESTRRLIWLKRGEIAVTLQPGLPTVLLGKSPMATLDAGHYNARHMGDQIVLTVVKGKAQLQGPGTSQPVAVEHQQVTLSASTLGALVRPASSEDLTAATAWQNGEIIFRDEPLEDAAREYNRYLDKKIEILDPRVKAERVGGRFTTTDPHDFLHALDVAQGLHVIETDEKYVIVK